MKQYIRIIVLLVLITSCTSKKEPSEPNALHFTSLKCNDQVNPIASDLNRTTFSWVIEAEGYNKSQSAYQILVASSHAVLDDSEGDVWNSEKVSSDQSAYVLYDGDDLQPTTKYWWKVRIWDENGNTSGWSSVNSFETALQDENDWSDAQWLALNEDTRESDHRFRPYKIGQMKEPVMVTSQPVGYFRNIIDAQKTVQSARAYICGLGYYEFFINGNKVGDHVLDPAPSNYNKQAYYVTYDVTDAITKGRNALGIVLGNGFYGQSISWKRDPESERSMSYGEPTVRLMLQVAYADGTKEQFTTNKLWKNSTGPIVFDNVYGGDTYDARYELGDWNTVTYNDSQWGKVKTIEPNLRTISPNQMPPIRKLHTLNPINVFKSVRGTWIVDFGQNIAGWVKIAVKGESGNVINIRTTEALTQTHDDIFLGSTGGGANGMPQVYTYICKGGGLEKWEPKFSYHGFRYAEITGVNEKPSADMIQAVMVATDVKQTGKFSSSCELFNKMDTISQWTVIDNLHGIPEDCPHREKCGWLGDAHAFCEYALYNYDMKAFYRKYMEDIRTQMRKTSGANNPAEKFMVPTMIAPGKRTSSIAKLDWGIATIYLPWYNYLYYGDDEIVKEYYQDMKQLTNYYLSFKTNEGIIDNGMGDWCPPLWDRKRNPLAMECHPVVSANAYFYDILKVMESFAVVVGDIDYKQTMLKEQALLKDAFTKKYLESIPLVNLEWYGSQTATVMALQFGMVPDDKIENVVAGLVHNIKAVKGGHHATGIHGNRYIYTVLAKNGLSDLAYDILTVPTFPSQTYVMNYGFTTWPERQFFWEQMSDLSNSLNHPMHSGFAAYFYECMGGIKPRISDPGYKVFTVQPILPNNVSETEVTVPTPYGSIKNSVASKNGNVTMSLTIPFNTTALVSTSDINCESLLVNGQPFINTSAINNEQMKLGSGEYTIKYAPLK